MSRRRQNGFGLLEALVALVLFSALGLALFGWINANLDAAVRLRARDADRHVEQLAMAWVQSLDPLRRPQGETELETGLRLRWTATPRTPLTASAPLPGGTASLFRLALYEVDMVLSPAGRPPLRLSAMRVGVERDGARNDEIPR